MYVDPDYATKQDLKTAVKTGARVTVFQPGPFAKPSTSYQGTCYISGPHAPAQHRWYATVTVRDGIVTSVK